MKQNAIKNIDDLRSQITILEEKKLEQETVLKENFLTFYETFHPINILTNALANIFERKTDSKKLLKSALLYGVDVLISNIWMKKSSENLKGMVSNIAQAFVSEFLSFSGNKFWEGVNKEDETEENEKEENDQN